MPLQIAPRATDSHRMTPLLRLWSPSKLQARQLQARSSLLPSSSLRAECVPPSLVYAPSAGSPWQRFMFWLLAPAPTDTATAPNLLGRVKRDFGATLADVDTAAADDLRGRIHEAHSLRELWHLRSDVYGAVSTAHGQLEAEARLILINAHFPVRAPRAQPGAH